MNLYQWCRLREGDLLHWNDQIDGPFFRLLKPIHRVPRDRHQNWPLAWTWEQVDPAIPSLWHDRPMVDADMREFWLVKGLV